MTHLQSAAVVLCLILPAAMTQASETAIRPLSENEKIESLIAHVEGLKDAKFIRNGIEYDAKTAGAFLRGKWDTNKAKIKTASDFIQQVATKSSTTGKPYLIRLKDGQEHKSGEYLAEQLKMLK